MIIATCRRASNPRISIVIPAKNEEHNLRVVLPRLPSVHEVILVNGSSVDRTVEVAREVMPSIRVVQQTRSGKGNALACGFAVATGDIIVMFDADGSADPDEIPRFVAALIAGADFAKGSRYAHGGGSDDLTRLRSVGNVTLAFIANRVLGTHYTDLCYGFNAFWADVLGELDLPDHRITPTTDSMMLWGDGFEIETLITCRVAVAQLLVAEVASNERMRLHGVSHLSAFRDGLRVLNTLRIERQRARLLRSAAAPPQPAGLRARALPR